MKRLGDLGLFEQYSAWCAKHAQYLDQSLQHGVARYLNNEVIVRLSRSERYPVAIMPILKLCAPSTDGSPWVFMAKSDRSKLDLLFAPMAQSKVFKAAVANSAKFSLGCPAPSPSTSVTIANESQPKKKAARKSKAKPKASPKKVDGLCGVDTIAAVTNLLDDVLNMIDAAVENAEKIDTDKTYYVLGIAFAVRPSRHHHSSLR